VAAVRGGVVIAVLVIAAVIVGCFVLPWAFCKAAARRDEDLPRLEFGPSIYDIEREED
jgi:hypothetical protein